ncbi:MAG: hypothetical protein ACYTAN_10970 [Planctomycetota bacterium]|jgi:hypothetical protein
MRLLRVFTPILFLLLAVSTLSADEVVLKGGGVIKGSVVSEGTSFLVLKTAYGTVTLETGDVSEVRYSTADEKKLLADLAALEPTDIDSRLKLARRAAAGGLGDAAKRIYAEILAVEPDENTARKALGYVKYGDEWIIPNEDGERKGLVPYEGRWVSAEERNSLQAADADRDYFATFELSAGDGYRILEGISDFDVSIEPRGGYIVRRHVKTYEVKDKDYFYSVDALTWKRLGVFVGVTFIDKTRKKTPGFGELKYTIYSVAVDALGNARPDRKLLSEIVYIRPDMWEKRSDFTYWDTRINHSSYQKHASDELRKRWAENNIMNCGGILYVLANSNVELLSPPNAYYVEAVFTLKGKEKKVGRYVQYAQAR